MLIHGDGRDGGHFGVTDRDINRFGVGRRDGVVFDGDDLKLGDVLNRRCQLHFLARRNGGSLQVDGGCSLIQEKACCESQSPIPVREKAVKNRFADGSCGRGAFDDDGTRAGDGRTIADSDRRRWLPDLNSKG